VSDAWDKALHGLSDLELDLIMVGAKRGTLRAVGSADNGIMAGLKAAIERARRKQMQTPPKDKLLEARLREARRMRPDDHVGKAWPSDELRNFSADGREAGVRAADVFRRELVRSRSQTTEPGEG
jgi:hypothetical protein